MWSARLPHARQIHRRPGRVLDMKMETSLKPQDKKTIAIVLYLAVVVLFGWYMIRPAAMKFVEMDDKIRSAELTKQEYRMKRLQLGTAEILYNRAVTDITASTKNFYDVMDNSKIEKMGTAYILKFGLTPVDFTVNLRDGSYVKEAPYAYSGIKEEKADSSSSTETPDVDTSTTVKDASAMATLDVKSLQVFYAQAIAGVKSTEPSEVECAKISIVVQGTQERCQTMIDDITKNPSIRVTGFSWADAKEVWSVDEKGNKTLMNPDYKELKLDLNFYMTEKPHFEKSEG